MLLDSVGNVAAKYLRPLDRLYWQCCSHIVYAFGQAVLAMLQPYSLCFWTGGLGNVAAM